MTLTKRTLLASAAMLAMAGAASAEIAMSGVLTDVEDGNRFFTRLGGNAHETLSITGLEVGTDYVLTTELVDATTGEEVHEAQTEFTADAADREEVVTLPVPRNEGEINVDYVTVNTLRTAADGETVLAELTGEASDPERAIQVHSIQRLGIVSVADSTDGDNRIDGKGGPVNVTVRYENMVEGYDYAVWGQMLTESGQSRGIFASIPEFAPEGKAGELTLVFEIPEGLEGTSVVPSVGIFHQNRVEILEDGNLVWIPGSNNPVMIASDTDLTSEERKIEVGVPFGETE